MEKKWRRFEKLVAEVQRELAPGAVVTHDDHIKGFDSDTMRQIDVSVKQPIGQYEILIAIDCKDYKEPVDVKDVEEFIGLIRDIRANKGVMVAANGFTETAKRIGEKAGLNCYRLIDTEEHDWQTYVAIPMVCDFRRIQYQLILPIFLANQDPRSIMIYDSNNEPVDTTERLIQKRWNNGELPFELGQHNNIRLVEGKQKVLVNSNHVDANILANIFVTRRLFFGELPLLQVRGFADEHQGQLISRGFTTDWLDVRTVESDWRQLEDISELSVTVLTLEAADLFDIPAA